MAVWRRVVEPFPLCQWWFIKQPLMKISKLSTLRNLTSNTCHNPDTIRPISNRMPINLPTNEWFCRVIIYEIDPDATPVPSPDQSIVDGSFFPSDDSFLPADLEASTPRTSIFLQSQTGPTRDQPFDEDAESFYAPDQSLLAHSPSPQTKPSDEWRGYKKVRSEIIEIPSPSDVRDLPHLKEGMIGELIYAIEAESAPPAEMRVVDCVDWTASMGVFMQAGLVVRVPITRYSFRSVLRRLEREGFSMCYMALRVLQEEWVMEELEEEQGEQDQSNETLEGTTLANAASRVGDNPGEVERAIWDEFMPYARYF